MKMMTIALAMISLLGLGCAKGGDSNQQTQQPVVTTGTTDYCVMYPQNCNQNYNNNNYNSNYNSNYYYSSYGFQPNNYNNIYDSLCNCPAGTMPTYNSYSGMGCVNSNFSNNTGYSAYAYISIGSRANNSQWMNIPQVSNYVGYGNQSCYNGAVQSCATDQPSSCASGYTCRASNASSRLGLCVSNSSTTTGPVFR